MNKKKLGPAISAFGTSLQGIGIIAAMNGNKIEPWMVYIAAAGYIVKAAGSMVETMFAD